MANVQVDIGTKKRDSFDQNANSHELISPYQKYTDLLSNFNTDSTKNLDKTHHRRASSSHIIEEQNLLFNPNEFDDNTDNDNDLESKLSELPNINNNNNNKHNRNISHTSIDSRNADFLMLSPKNSNNSNNINNNSMNSPNNSNNLWACPTCTYQNNIQMVYCELCGCNKPTEPSLFKVKLRGNYYRYSILIYILWLYKYIQYRN